MAARRGRRDTNQLAHDVVAQATRDEEPDDEQDEDDAHTE